eukprot:CAMPEP_0194522042 /NCGR_PEP_ID=MMETSP0253-20130528/56492_1 /TAXON_ID=2966 /ORGANISM="Noctiluca scintillans" /LENGTH=365 /DNA_ID=CAMNT_0039366445 /DNA_START=137 /DNA_END=1234 /DNA_ORIENTATION=+
MVADPGRMRDAGFCQCEDIEQLWQQKACLDEMFDAGGERFYQRAREELFPSSRGTSRALRNRAGMKLAEVLSSVGGLGSAIASESETVFVDICGGPGAWSHHLMRLEQQGIKMRGFGFSLREGTNPASCAWSQELCARQNFEPLWGADGTGDVCNAENIAHSAKKVGRNASIVVADGGFGVGLGPNGEHMENYQEIFCGRLLLAEMLMALEVIRTGGCFVCKLFDTFSSISVGLLFVAAALFEETFVVKPRTSRIVNSERYLVAKGFRGTSACFDTLLDVVRNTHASWSASGWKGVAPSSVVCADTLASSDLFLASVHSMVATLCKRQTSALRAVVERARKYSELDTEGDAEQERLRKAAKRFRT